MMPADPWDNLPSGDFFQWEEPGTTLTGDVVGKRIGKDFNQIDAPELDILQDDGEKVTMTAGQAQLRAKLLEARPQIGDRIRIVFTGTEKRQGGKTLKNFDVQVKPQGAKNKAAVAAAQAAPAAAAPAQAALDDDF